MKPREIFKNITEKETLIWVVIILLWVIALQLAFGNTNNNRAEAKIKDSEYKLQIASEHSDNLSLLKNYRLEDKENIENNKETIRKLLLEVASFEEGNRLLTDSVEVREYQIRCVTAQFLWTEEWDCSTESVYSNYPLK